MPENIPENFSGKKFPQNSGDAVAVGHGDGGLERMTITQSAKAMLDMLSDMSLSEGLLSDISFRDFEPEPRQQRLLRHPEVRQNWSSNQQLEAKPIKHSSQSPQMGQSSQSLQKQDAGQLNRSIQGPSAISPSQQEEETSFRPTSSRPSLIKQHQSSSSSHRLT